MYSGILHAQKRAFLPVFFFRTTYLSAFEQIESLGGARHYRPSSHDLLNIHRIIVEGVRGGSRYAGRFRSEEVKVGDIEGGETIVHHHPPQWSQVDDEIDALMRWIHHAARKTDHEALLAGEPDEWVHPVVIAGIAHHRLVWIHPFVDGNGRTARMFTALLLYLRSYDFRYLFDLSSYYNSNRDAYYGALRSADQSGDYTQWLEYFMGGFSMQMYEIGQKALQVKEDVPTSQNLCQSSAESGHEDPDNEDPDNEELEMRL